jgi:hypothetical protein
LRIYKKQEIVSDGEAGRPAPILVRTNGASLLKAEVGSEDRFGSQINEEDGTGADPERPKLCDESFGGSANQGSICARKTNDAIFLIVAQV